MHVLTLHLDLRFPGCRSLKEKRAVLRPVLEGLRNRHPVGAAEVERFVWSFPELEVLNASRRWLEDD